ncbi:hypothetical protein [Kitasatospora sp. NPDC088548]|uniref:hypothetical protein n=1 Tax=Kitasatospora sp. NPDC088548 TaxID=3364075 RepID=UPI003817CE9A
MGATAGSAAQTSCSPSHVPGRCPGCSFVQANLSPCWTTPVNVGKMTGIQAVVAKQLAIKENLVEMQVVPDYMYAGSMTPFKYRFKIQVRDSRGVLVDCSASDVYSERDGHSLEAGCC